MKVALFLLSLSFLTPLYALAQGKYLYECEGCLDSSDFTRFAIGTGLSEVYLYNRETLDIRAYQIKEGRDPEVPLVLAFEIEPDTAYVHALRDVLQTVSAMSSLAIPFEDLDVPNSANYDSALKLVGRETASSILSLGLTRKMNKSIKAQMSLMARETMNGNAVSAALGWKRGSGITIRFSDGTSAVLEFNRAVLDVLSNEYTYLYDVMHYLDADGVPISSQPRDYRDYTNQGSERFIRGYHDMLGRLLFGGVGVIQVGCQIGTGQSTMRCAENADGVLKCAVVYVKPAC